MEAINKKIAKLNLPFIMDKRTPGRGNYFFHTVIQQCQWPDMNLKMHKNPIMLRKEVCNFALEGNDIDFTAYNQRYNDLQKQMGNPNSGGFLPRYEEKWCLGGKSGC